MERILLFLMFSIVVNVLGGQELVSVEFKKSFSKELLNQDLSPLIQNGVSIYKVLYTTRDLEGAVDTASGILVIPDIEEGMEYPLLVYQHGTSFSSDDLPSSIDTTFALEIAFSGFGYVTIASDLLGFGASRGFHPYVHADSEAWAAVDMIRAVKQYFATNAIPVNDQLFVTGYSQGGHASMALHRALELEHADEFTVTAAAPMSGPYSISGVMRDIMLMDSAYSVPAYLPNTILSYEVVYDLFDKVEDYFKLPYSIFINQYFNDQISLGELNDKLDLFLSSNIGAAIPKFMLQDSIIEAATNNLNHPLNLALKDNDLFEWTPQVPTRIIYCMSDDQIPFRNSIIADSVMNLMGAPNVSSIDIAPDRDHVGCVFPAILEALLFFIDVRNGITSTEKIVSVPANFNIYPNPAGDYFIIQNAPEKALVQLLDLSGKLHQELVVQSNSEEFRLSNLEVGIYLVKIVSAKGSWTRKVVVNN